jgi:peptidoglycan hydrolase-like protein with peptidoglycan-binding domain
MTGILSNLRYAALLLSLMCGSKLALADFAAAQREFLQRSTEERAEIVSALIADGDYKAIYDGQYSPRIQVAIEAFQTREGFPPTGLLPPNQLAILKADAHEETSLPPYESFLIYDKCWHQFACPAG